MRIDAFFCFIANNDFEPHRLHNRIQASLDNQTTYFPLTQQSAINCLYKLLKKLWSDTPELQLPFESSVDWWHEQFSKQNYQEILLSAVSQLADDEALTLWEESAAKDLYGCRKTTNTDRYEQELLGYLWRIHCSSTETQWRTFSSQQLEALRHNFRNNILPQREID